MEKKYRYCVLYVQDAAQNKLKGIIEKWLPREKGEVFIPRMEYYRRGEKAVREMPIFPGYVFLYTSLNMKEVHELLLGCRRELNLALRELALRERQLGEPDFLYAEAGDGALYELSDLNEEETQFLDILRMGDGLLAMSCGYEEKKRYYVMEGPLQAFEDKIVRVDKHNRKAFLKFEVRERQARAGFECKPKAHWYPEEDAKIETLSDGTEVDLEELKKSIMKI